MTTLIFSPFKNEWYFPQSAVIRNQWLPKLEFFCKWAVIIVFIAMVFVVLPERVLSIEYPIADVSFWASKGTAISKAEATIRSGKVPSWCNDPMHNYYYGYGWTYFNYTCVAPSFSEMHAKMETSIFYLLSFEETTTHVEDKATFNAAESCVTGSASKGTLLQHPHECDPVDDVCSCSWKAMYFALPHDEMAMAFQHAYETNTLSGHSQEMTTYVYDHLNKRQYTFENVAPKLLMYQWLELVGIDDLNAENKENFVSVPHPNVIGPPYRSPIYRITGLKIKLRIVYSNIHTKQRELQKDPYGNEYPNPQVSQNLDEVLCQVFPSAKTAWNSRGSLVTYTDYPELPRTQAERVPYSTKYRFTDRYRYGLTFLFMTEGHIGQNSFMQILQQLLNIFVLMRVVSEALKMLALTLWPSFDSSIYYQQLFAPIAEKTRRMYWTKYIYNIAFLGFAENGKVSYDKWVKFCEKHQLAPNQVKRTWEDAFNLDRDKIGLDRCRDNFCDPGRKYITLASVCRASKRSPISPLGRLMQQVENEVVVDFLAGMHEEKDDRSKETGDADTTMKPKRHSEGSSSRNRVRTGRSTLHPSEELLPMNREDYKIFFRDIPKLHKIYNLPPDLLAKEKALWDRTSTVEDKKSQRLRSFVIGDAEDYNHFENELADLNKDIDDELATDSMEQETGSKGTTATTTYQGDTVPVTATATRDEGDTAPATATATRDAAILDDTASRSARGSQDSASHRSLGDASKSEEKEPGN